MKSLIIPALICLSLTATYSQQISIIRQELNIVPDGTHNYLYETSNGIYEDQQGYPKGPEIQAVQGQFQYVSPEGELIYLRYVSDENGFQPQGSHLPTAPPVPPAIQRSLDYLAKVKPQT
ncbi:endocuticle structural glycoprotein SgAbd-2-like [Anoplophora glabripennis]|uniref:endocuticle structural glycoprotein SgAbd-2-like n=1 Tax=Anoplophora glabripennis TaxID=217634 RepID=UPI0008737F5C|nr:endocuticle structural glycoprotein SgAbd-2-like [Anoplophora glabripennis]